MAQRIQPPELNTAELEQFNHLRDLLGCYCTALETRLGAESLLPAFQWWQKADTDLTLEDLAHAIFRANLHSVRPTSMGRMLVVKLRTITHQVKTWWAPRSYDDKSEAWKWFGQGLYVVTSEMADFVLQDLYQSPADYRAKLDARIVECEEEAADDPDCQSPWDDTEKAIADAWFAASPYTLWAMHRDARQAGIDAVEGELFEFACGTESGKSIGEHIEKTFTDVLIDWMKGVENAFKEAA